MSNWKDKFPKENRYFETENGILYCGDCLEIMREFPEESIDLVLTDPPYNAGRNFENDNLLVNEYKKFVEKFFRIIKNLNFVNISIIIGVKYQKEWIINLFSNFYFNWEFIWWKSNGMLNGKATFSKFDKVLWFSKTEKSYYNRNLKEVPTDVWNLPIRNYHKTEFYVGHPTPKDIKGIMKILHILSKKNSLVLDPFIGSGTTAVACEKLNRKWIGIEINPKYCEIAKQRILKETKRTKLNKFFGNELLTKK